jgi:hypothetical protein
MSFSHGEDILDIRLFYVQMCKAPQFEDPYTEGAPSPLKSITTIYF